MTLAALVGFGHAFEADHLLAVSTLVSKSESQKQVWKNGFIWGLGHTSTLLLVGILILWLQVNSLPHYFDYLEIFVGIMLIALGGTRLFFHLPHSHSHLDSSHDKEAYGIGLVHGLAGSGTLILLVLANQTTPWEALGYMGLFGIGSALGMSCAASLMRMPLLKNSHERDEKRRKLFTSLSSLLCIAYGLYILLRFTT